MKWSKKPTSKINRIRSWALGLIFAAMIVMYLGVVLLYMAHSRILFGIFLILGTLAFALSFVVYFWIGMLSMRAVTVLCPNCNHYTKMLGRADICANCNEPLTLDPTLEGKEFNEDYNNKRKSEALEKKEGR
ncbi:hypothetical protein ERX37_09115 [Macrococcus hajekii]|uniref:Uncharacterized protein n=1 Tax=Macrococcus hajekii TaxID=198482 RepID=A0A4R6BIA8_9STAP|nr:YgzB family protein [Macrococcus hajekii]TDM01266.1 hypothetical protein ERX37_09115 [Macrococcus hajekii]GGB10174.1 UPF0295 protein YgzB [Macrococcus hajekii]